MTCIVALIDNGMPYLAGDALVVNMPHDYHSKVSQVVRREPKIFSMWQNGMLVGYNGSVRMGQLLSYVFEFPEYTASQEKLRYLVALFIPALQKCFADAKFQEEGGGLEGGILLALEGELFTIGDDFSVCNTANAYAAIGQASEVAIGSLHTTGQLGLPPRERLLLALTAAEQHTCVVSAPFTYLTAEMTEAVEL